jgi:hypothetical protein
LQPHSIADQHPDEIPSRPARHMCRHLPLPIDHDPIQPVRQVLEDRAFDRATNVPRILVRHTDSPTFAAPNFSSASGLFEPV